MDIYTRLAPHYDRLFPVSDAQAAFVGERLAALGARRVLDAGCGTGRHLELLALRGYGVVGLEPDAAMAGLAAARLGARGQVLTAGLEDAVGALAPLAPFDAALCLGNTLAHLVTPGALAAALAALAALLTRDGLLVTQTVNFDRVLTAHRADFPERRLADGLAFTRDYTFTHAPARLGFRLALTGPGVALEDTIPLVPLTRDEQVAALRAAGFRRIEAHGDWDGAAWSAEAPATILLARR